MEDKHGECYFSLVPVKSDLIDILSIYTFYEHNFSEYPLRFDKRGVQRWIVSFEQLLDVIIFEILDYAKENGLLVSFYKPKKYLPNPINDTGTYFEYLWRIKIHLNGIDLPFWYNEGMSPIIGSLTGINSKCGRVAIFWCYYVIRMVFSQKLVTNRNYDRCQWVTFLIDELIRKVNFLPFFNRYEKPNDLINELYDYQFWENNRDIMNKIWRCQIDKVTDGRLCMVNVIISNFLIVSVIQTIGNRDIIFCKFSHGVELSDKTVFNKFYSIESSLFPNKINYKYYLPEDDDHEENMDENFSEMLMFGLTIISNPNYIKDLRNFDFWINKDTDRSQALIKEYERLFSNIPSHGKNYDDSCHPSHPITKEEYERVLKTNIEFFTYYNENSKSVSQINQSLLVGSYGFYWPRYTPEFNLKIIYQPIKLMTGIHLLEMHYNNISTTECFPKPALYTRLDMAECFYYYPNNPSFLVLSYSRFLKECVNNGFIKLPFNLVFERDMVKLSQILYNPFPHSYDGSVKNVYNDKEKIYVEFGMKDSETIVEYDNGCGKLCDFNGDKSEIKKWNKWLEPSETREMVKNIVNDWWDKDNHILINMMSLKNFEFDIVNIVSFIGFNQGNDIKKKSSSYENCVIYNIDVDERKQWRRTLAGICEEISMHFLNHRIQWTNTIQLGVIVSYFINRYVNGNMAIYWDNMIPINVFSFKHVIFGMKGIEDSGFWVLLCMNHPLSVIIGGMHDDALKKLISEIYLDEDKKNVFMNSHIHILHLDSHPSKIFTVRKRSSSKNFLFLPFGANFKKYKTNFYFANLLLAESQLLISSSKWVVLSK
jgi:hypothetical protein